MRNLPSSIWAAPASRRPRAQPGYRDIEAQTRMAADLLICLFAQELPGGCCRQQLTGQDPVGQRFEVAILSAADPLAHEIGGGAGDQIARPPSPALPVIDLQSCCRRDDGFGEGGNALPGGGGG